MNTENLCSLKVWGEFACFTRPEMKVERMSYLVPTPSAARGIFEAILYKPEFRWQVREIQVLKPIQFITLRRNEVKGIATGKNPKPQYADSMDEENTGRTQRQTVALYNVAYILKAEILLKTKTSDTANTAKYSEMFQRYVKQGKCYNMPSFGCREFAAYYEEPEGNEKSISETKNLGLMLYDVFDATLPSGRIKDNKELAKRKNISFFKARMENGIVKVPPWSSDEVLKTRQEVLS